MSLAKDRRFRRAPGFQEWDPEAHFPAHLADVLYLDEAIFHIHADPVARYAPLSPEELNDYLTRLV